MQNNRSSYSRVPVVDKVAAADRDRDRVLGHRGLERALRLFRHGAEARDAGAAPLQGGALGLLPPAAGSLALVDARVGIVLFGVEAAPVLDDVVDAACFVCEERENC